MKKKNKIILKLEAVDFGKYKGRRWSRVPLVYLNWLVNNTTGEYERRAILEIERRATKRLTKKRKN